MLQIEVNCCNQKCLRLNIEFFGLFNKIDALEKICAMKIMGNCLLDSVSIS